MNKPNLKVVGTRTPEREALAKAIEQAELWRSEQAKFHLGLSNANKRIQEMESVAATATAAADEEAARAQRDLTAQLIGGEENIAPPERVAAAEASKAERDLKMLRTARDELAAKADQAAAEITAWERRVTEAITKVVAADPAKEKGLVMFSAAQAQMQEARAVIHFLWQNVGWPESNQFPAINFASGVDQELPTDSPWRAWVNALKTDADAVLPEA